MTLFYLPANQYRLKTSAAGPHSDSGDELLTLVGRTQAEQQLVKSVLGDLQAQTDVEFQAHIHHEHLVGNDGEWSDFHRTLKGLTNPQQDVARLHYLVRTELATMRQDTGAAFDKWAFVHGMWALNGSDRTVCQIDNEIEILMEHGCWGDFTFPAGRYHCDPTLLHQPYTCEPFVGPKGYDDPRCAPITVDVGARSIREGRFLIWNSKANHDVCSVDHYDAVDLRRVRNSDHIVFTWLTACPVIDQVLYIKTHAHSMNAAYYENEIGPPVASPHMEVLLGLVRRACDEAGAEFRPATVGEVYATLRELDARSETAPTSAATSAIQPCELTSVSSAGVSDRDANQTVNFSLTNLFATSILQDWIKADRAHARGAGSYYEGRLSRGKLFVESELAIAEYCRDRFERSTRFVELGAGFGELSLMLSLSGFSATGFESDSGRYAGAEALVAGLHRMGVQTGSLSLVHGAFPDALGLGLFDHEGETVLVATNVTSSHVMESIQRVYRALRLFDHLIVDITRFGVSRSEQLQRELIADLGRAGFVEIRQVYANPDSPDIRHFQRTAPGVQPDRPAVAPAVEALRYSDLGNPIPHRLLKTPFHIFNGKEVSAELVLPRLAQVPRNWLPSMPIRVGTFPSLSAEPSSDKSPTFREGREGGLGTFVFENFGDHYVECSYGVFKCLMLDPACDRDARALEIFRFAAANIVHSCVDKSIIAPWAKRPTYVRPDLLLDKLFRSDQPLALHCDHASELVSYLLHIDGYRVREIAMIDPSVNSGHFVAEVFLPGCGRWVMLDPDYGVVVSDRNGVLLGCADIVACLGQGARLAIKRVVPKRWTVGRFDVGEAYSGQQTWQAVAPMGGPTVSGDSYHDMMERWFRARREIIYRFADGFEDNRVEVEPSADVVVGAGSRLQELGERFMGQRELEAAVSPEGPIQGPGRERDTDLRWDRRLSQLLVPVLRHQIERFGPDVTGAYNFNQTPNTPNTVLGVFGLGVARELLRRDLGITRVDEVGSGFGQLAFLLGWSGFHAFGFDADSARARTARRLRAILELTDPELTRNVMLIEDEFPSKAAPPPGPGSLVLTTNLVATRTQPQQAAIVEAMRCYSFTLVDIQRFFEHRVSEAAQQSVLALFSEAGFEDPELFLDLGEAGRYYLFRNKSRQGAGIMPAAAVNHLHLNEQPVA